MNSDKAYLIGLIIGGGTFNQRLTNLTITLPYRQWGKVILNPERAGGIATDILSRVSPIFEHEYGISVAYSTTPEWRIRCIGRMDRLVNDFTKLGIAVPGELRKNVTLSELIPHLNYDETIRKNFIAGLGDSVGSLAPSHRRFDDDYQIISFEFSGNNFELVYQVCRLLKESGCFPDQVLWNHPNQHSTDNPYYRNWKKGFKLRVLLDEYTTRGSFLFQAKAEAARENRGLQRSEYNVAIPCEAKRISVTPTTVHKAENDPWLPPNLRGLHFVHHKHICAVLGCPHAPIDSLMPYLSEIEKYINPFPIISRGTKKEIWGFVNSDPVMRNREYIRSQEPLNNLVRMFSDGQNLLWGRDSQTGYPLSEILQSMAYISAGLGGRLFGTRVRGNFLEEIDRLRSSRVLRRIRIFRPDKLTPIIIEGGEYAAMVGPQNPAVYKKLITVIDSLKIKIRNIREEDLHGQ